MSTSIFGSREALWNQPAAAGFFPAKTSPESIFSVARTAFLFFCILGDGVAWLKSGCPKNSQIHYFG
jgi:hypothetical protein